MRIKKKIFVAVLSAALVCTGLPIQGIGTLNVFAEEEVASDFDIDENGVLKKYSGAGGDVVIPEGVTSIGVYAFANCRSLTGITIPKGVTQIGSSAFYNCSSLISVTIPENVTQIGVWAFKNCSGLTSITVDKENSIYDSREDCNAIIETESNMLITGCQNTIIPKGVTSIGSSAFYGCSSLISITVPESVTQIGKFAFCDCNGLTSVTIPEGVTSIGDDAFEGCSGLTSITIPESAISIGESAFNGCSSLKSITIPEGLTEIGERAFRDCSGLTRITVDRENSKYDSREDCNAIIETDSNKLITGCQNTIIPKGVTSIGSSAFYGCNSLISIAIPEGVTKIGNSAFLLCGSLTNVIIPIEYNKDKSEKAHK